MTPTWATGDATGGAGGRERWQLRGFTLIELMVVLAIVALMSAALPVALNRMLPARRVAVAADRLVGDIQWLQIRSSATGTPARLTLHPSGYRLQARNEIRDIVLASSTTLRLMGRANGAETEVLIAYPDGTTSVGRFEFSDSGRRAIVETTMLTGRARRKN